VLAIASRHGVPATEIGKVGEVGEPLVLIVGKQRFETPVRRLTAVYHGAIPAMMSKVATADDSETAGNGLEPAVPRASSLEPSAQG
jgi:hypothetical protein